MRIYAAADLHGKPSRFAMVREALGQHRVDALLLAGDILHYGRGRNLLPLIDALPLPVFIVRGNSDPPYLEAWAAASRNVRSLHLNPVSLQGADCVGISGTLPVPFASFAGWRERATLSRLAPMIHSRSLLVAHPPPRGCCDRVMGRFRAGSFGLARLVAKTAPAVLLCGHIHEAAGVERLGPTLVVNCALGPRCRGALVVIEGRRPPVAELL